MNERYLKSFILEDLKEKMVFLAGPRQCGKTTLAKDILSKVAKNKNEANYFTWDDDLDKVKLRKREWNLHAPLICFDELHKYRKWKDWIKGIFDKKPKGQNYLVTGSARLDIYRKGRDSLFGRYHFWRLHPFTIDECPTEIDATECFRRLMKVGGFPEPFLKNDNRQASRWRRDRFEKVVKQDIRDLESIKTIDELVILLELLRERVKNLISINNLSEDLQVAHATVKNWLRILEHMYIIFSVSPFSTKLSRANHKQSKIYFYDNAEVPEDKDGTLAARFENLVAAHLLKRIQFLEDYSGEFYKLCFIRDKDGREVDFAIVKNNKVIELIEVKLSDDKPSNHLNYFGEKLNVEKRTQIVAKNILSKKIGKIWVCGPVEYFSANKVW